MNIKELQCPTCGEFAISTGSGSAAMEGVIVCPNNHDWRQDMSLNVINFPDGTYEISDTKDISWQPENELHKILFEPDGYYWKERCLLAEDYINKSQCKPLNDEIDDYNNHVNAGNKWREKINEH